MVLRQFLNFRTKCTPCSVDKAELLLYFMRIKPNRLRYFQSRTLVLRYIIFGKKSVFWQTTRILANAIVAARLLSQDVGSKTYAQTSSEVPLPFSECRRVVFPVFASAQTLRPPFKAPAVSSVY